jgi:hypothetical protein
MPSFAALAVVVLAVCSSLLSTSTAYGVGEFQNVRPWLEEMPLPAFALTKQPVPSVVLKVFVFLSLQDAALVGP